MQTPFRIHTEFSFEKIVRIGRYMRIYYIGERVGYEAPNFCSDNRFQSIVLDLVLGNQIVQFHF